MSDDQRIYQPSEQEVKDSINKHLEKWHSFRIALLKGEISITKGDETLSHTSDGFILTNSDGDSNPLGGNSWDDAFEWLDLPQTMTHDVFREGAQDE